MKTSEKKIEEEDLIESSNETLDPYAVDFFSVPDLSIQEDQINAKKNKTNDKNKKSKIKDVKGLNWHKNLPKLTVQEVDFSNQIKELPVSVSDIAEQSFKQVFSRFTQIDQEKISCQIKSILEVDLLDLLADLNQNPQVFLTLQSVKDSQASIITLNTEFAAAVIDLVLGGKGKSSAVLRQLSVIEQTIIEFLAANVFGHINRSLEDSAFRLKSVGSVFVADFKEGERGAEIIMNLSVGELVGNLNILMPQSFMNALNHTQRHLFVNETPKQKFKKCTKISEDVALNVFMGDTQINANDILFLEKDDVILIENPKQNLKEQIKVFVGDSTNYFLRGNLSNSLDNPDEDILSKEILIEVQEIFNEKDKQSQPKREKMDKLNKQENKESNEQDVDVESQNVKSKEDEIVDERTEQQQQPDDQLFEEEIDEEALASLENVMINLRVNLGGRRLSLGELQKIRVGQIIELGCRPNDPVEVLTDSDNRPIATGELIEIEGQIGVRLTKVLV